MAQTHAIDIQNMRFEPADLAIAAGDGVEWTNRMAMPHTVAPDNDEFEGSGPLGPNETFSHAFESAGTTTYHCEIHPFMKGRISVEGTAVVYTPEAGRRFWFEFDGATKYNPSFMDIISQAGGFRVQNDFRTTRSLGTYPDGFKQIFLPRREDWVQIADVQTGTIERFLGTEWSNIQAALEDFGQGTLLEPDPVRQANNDSIHTMDVQDEDSPPVGYHRWHASIRAIQLLEIGDAEWWENLDRLIGLAWAIQSFARPRQQTVPNPALAQTDLQELRDAWLALSPEDRDRQYDLTPEPLGYHPAPKQPAKQEPAVV